jgi:aminopeptidase-like protein
MTMTNPFSAGLEGSLDLVEEADALLRRLFPICRSLTGNGVRETLGILCEIAEFDTIEIPSGTACYDWVVPEEWNVTDAYVADSSGRRVIDFRENNLHLVGYSTPIDREMTFAELEPHLHTLPDLPEAIPYRTSYYQRSWGFCLSHNEFLQLARGERYRVRIESQLDEGGSMTLGEGLIVGESGLEFLISTYSCHPSLANDNLSGLVVWALLYRSLKSRRTRHSYRFVIAPETIGAIAYLARHEKTMRRLAAGLVITTVAGPGPFGYKRTFLGDHLIDDIVEQAFRELGLDYVPYEFALGSDERQYSAPYFRVPVGTISKDKYQEYAYYHTSLDDLDFVRAECLVSTLTIYERVIANLEMNATYRSLSPHCEPMLGKRGLWPGVGGHINQPAADTKTPHRHRRYALQPEQALYGSELDALLWTMFYGDGRTSILELAQKTGLPMSQLYEAAETLDDHGLLERVPFSAAR